jgi:hypothetical protein
MLSEGLRILTLKSSEDSDVASQRAKMLKTQRTDQVPELRNQPVGATPIIEEGHGHGCYYI